MGHLKKRKKFAKDQPKDGDIILHCGHMDVKPFHFYKFEAPLPFRAPDGSTGFSSWVVQCANCHAKPDGPHVAAHDTWMGDEPAITVKEPN